MPAPKSLILAALGCAALVSAQEPTDVASVIEPSDFNITEALLEQGVDVAELPGLSDLTKRSELGCSIACNSLKLVFGDDAVETRNEASFANFTGSYWSSNQAEVTPYCIVKPSKPAQVSIVVLLSRLTQCPFAAKSGGHAAMAGASNIEGGITISFMNMKGVALSADKMVASIQPGNIWGEVFAELTKSDVTVVGGRLYNIGVGGLTTGGGISYFSNLYGWACDNVESFDVVIASGAIVRATPTQFPDLYWALRGGGNNFGLVVSFNLWTVPLPGGLMWGGSRTYTEDKFPAVSKAYTDILAASASDPKAGLYVVWAYDGGNKFAIPALYYAEPDGGNATIWSGFDAIEAVADTTKNRVLHEWGRETMGDSPPGLREVYYMITTRADPAIFEFARDLFYDNVDKVADIPGMIPVLATQGITTPQKENMRKHGGNPLGLDVEDGPVYIFQLCAMWDNKEDDATVYRFMSDILEQVTAEAKARGVDNNYIYMNYASQFQDVISSYGAENKAKLKSISAKYDPQQVFQKLQPGYFKLDRAPVPDSGYFSTGV
ncbi:FAD binding domain protein [Colletotrichum karsti]|uniref:FAD binding domain protein n=1 Tax=Colletotrichum karsti TaxID=1095194 RepID=A0A9P6IBY8_9PEZI|nr:FAD binding domain protein [Colletotrichum karsti]KAF9880572.1 FAD binding domain protein [Colletotrichum karsti]